MVQRMERRRLSALPEIQNRMSLATDRLKEAVEAMRNIQGISASEWTGRYPTFAEAVHRSILVGFSDQPWEKQCKAMNAELQLRIAEAILNP